MSAGEKKRPIGALVDQVPRDDRISPLTLALLAPVHGNGNTNHLLGGVLAVVGVATVPRIGRIVAADHVQPDEGEKSPLVGVLDYGITFWIATQLTSTLPN